MARAIPRLVRGIPAHDALHMRADGGIEHHSARGIPIGSNFLLVELENLPFSDLQIIDRLALRACQSVAQHVKRIVEIFSDVPPRATMKLAPVYPEQIEPRILCSKITISRHC